MPKNSQQLTREILNEIEQKIDKIYENSPQFECFTPQKLTKSLRQSQLIHEFAKSKPSVSKLSVYQSEVGDDQLQLNVERIESLDSQLDSAIKWKKQYFKEKELSKRKQWQAE